LIRANVWDMTRESTTAACAIAINTSARIDLLQKIYGHGSIGIPLNLSSLFEVRLQTLYFLAEVVKLADTPH